MLTNIRYILLTALRDWLFIGLFIGILVATGISATLGSTAFIEEKEMTLSFASGSARLILMTGLIIFVCFHIRSAFDTKEIDVILSRPISRSNLVISYFLGFSFVGLLLTIPIIAILGLIGVLNLSGFIAWAASLVLEMGLVVGVALFSAFTLRSAVTSVLGCMGFYVLSRMMAFFVYTAHSGMVAEPKFVVLRWALQAISTILPRLDFFGKSEWLIYGLKSAADFQIFAAQALIFVPILLFATMVDFKHKQF